MRLLHVQIKIRWLLLLWYITSKNNAYRLIIVIFLSSFTLQIFFFINYYIFRILVSQIQPNSSLVCYITWALGTSTLPDQTLGQLVFFHCVATLGTLGRNSVNTNKVLNCCPGEPVLREFCGIARSRKPQLTSIFYIVCSVIVLYKFRFAFWRAISLDLDLSAFTMVAILWREFRWILCVWIASIERISKEIVCGKAKMLINYIQVVTVRKNPLVSFFK